MSKKKLPKNELPQHSNKAEEAKKLNRTFMMITGVVLIALLIALLIDNYPKIIKKTASTKTSSVESKEAIESTPKVEANSETDTIVPPPTNKQYPSAPPMTIDVTKTYKATFTMANGGNFVIQLRADKAPITVNSFVFLAKEGFFNGVTFHRVLDGFMAQGGDPTGSGMGGPGYEFVNEDSDLKFDKAGVLAMANSGRNTNGSQFFITFAPQDFLNGGYTIFGQVVSGMNVVNALKRRNPEENPDFSGDVIRSVTIGE